MYTLYQTGTTRRRRRKRYRTDRRRRRRTYCRSMYEWVGFSGRSVDERVGFGGGSVNGGTVVAVAGHGFRTGRPGSVVVWRSRRCAAGGTWFTVLDKYGYSDALGRRLNGWGRATLLLLLMQLMRWRLLIEFLAIFLRFLRFVAMILEPDFHLTPPSQTHASVCAHNSTNMQKLGNTMYDTDSLSTVRSFSLISSLRTLLSFLFPFCPFYSVASHHIRCLSKGQGNAKSFSSRFGAEPLPSTHFIHCKPRNSSSLSSASFSCLINKSKPVKTAWQIVPGDR